MAGRISHKPEYSEAEYLAFAKALLGASLDESSLRHPMVGAAGHAFDSFLLRAEKNEDLTFILLLNSLAVWYAARTDLQNGRFPLDSPQAKVAEQLIHNILSICLPRIALSLGCGNYQAFNKLAAVMETAQQIPALGDQEAQDKNMKFLSKRLGLKVPKSRKASGRIRSLLPLWLLGFGELPQPKRYGILEKAGLRIEEIPEDDTLRQLLSYYKIPSIRAIIREARQKHPGQSK